MASDPILKLPDFNKTMFVQTDASSVAISGVLLQEFDGKRFPIAYVGRKLLDRETRYSVIKLECLALIYTMQKLRYYLIDRFFYVETDHSPLVFLNKYKQCANSRLTRWSLQLQEFRFAIKAISGSTNYGPDFMSRCPTTE